MPHQLTLSLLATLLFSDTQVKVNINGFLSASFYSGRGMRQGDPISPLLFNTIFDPFLRAINYHTHTIGFDFQSIIARTNANPPPSSLTDDIPTAAPVKVVLAYSDDTLVFLNNL